MKKIILSLISILLITGCNNQNNITDNKIKEEYTKIKSYNEKFEIKVPSDWKQTEEKGELNDSADLEIYEKSSQKYFIALMEAKEDLTWTFDEYKNEIFKQNQELYETTFTDIKEIKLNTNNASYVEFKTVRNNTNIYMRIYAIETTNYYGQLLIWTTYSQKDELNNEFNQMILSFKEI